MIHANDNRPPMPHAPLVVRVVMHPPQPPLITPLSVVMAVLAYAVGSALLGW